LPATIIDGRAVAEQLRSRIAVRTATLAGQSIVPGLAVVLVGDDADDVVGVLPADVRVGIGHGLTCVSRMLGVDAEDQHLGHAVGGPQIVRQVLSGY